MTSEDLHILCTALGFTAALTEVDEDATNQSNRALYLAKLIESFCHYAVPGIGVAAARNEGQATDAAIENLKLALTTRGDADMHQERAELVRLHERLCQRCTAYASDDVIADRVLALLDAEIAHDRDGR